MYPHLLYCSAVWGGAYKTDLDALFIAQKKILRVMNYKGRYEHTNILFNQYNLLKLYDILDLQAALFVYKSLNYYSMDTGFQPLPPSRRVNELRIPLYLTTHSQHSILVRGARLWNQFSNELRSSKSSHVFKNKYMKILLRKYIE